MASVGLGRIDGRRGGGITRAVVGLAKPIELFRRLKEPRDSIALLAGVHVGYFELFGNDSIRGIADLNGKSVGVQALGSTPHVLLTLIAAQIGLEPLRDIHWVTDPSVKPIELFVDGKIDAFLGFPPEPQELRARHIGRVIVNTAVDRPWSQYFCCLLGGNRDFVRKYPVTTKRVVRAILKAADLCATEPTRAARHRRIHRNARCARGLRSGGGSACPSPDSPQRPPRCVDARNKSGHDEL